MDMCGRSWIKVRYLSPQDAYEALRELSIVTYRYYYNGTYIQLYTLNEINSAKDLGIYEGRIEKLFQIKVNATDQGSSRMAKKIEIENGQSFFVWPYL